MVTKGYGNTPDAVCKPGAEVKMRSMIDSA